MPATVESAFVLIDRASGPTRRIRRELVKTRIEAERTGRALDDMAGPRQAQQLNRLADETQGVRRETQSLGSGLDRAGGQMDRYTGRVRGAARETRGLAQGLRDVNTVIGALRWPVLIAGAGGATQALGGLAGGAVALVPKVLDAGGAVVAAGNMMVGAAAGLGVAKLAFKDVGDAADGNREALKRLTPEARAFVQTLRQMRPEIRALQREAQRGIFPGVEDLLGAVRRQRGGARQIVRQTAGDLGGLASWGARRIDRRAMRDLVELSDIGGRALGSAARSGFRFATAVEQILIAGGPLTDWLGNTVEGWSKTAEQEARVARETGRLDRFFDRTRDTLEDFGDTAQHVWGGLVGTMGAARGQSDSLWESINGGAERWDRWANSVGGQTTMRRWFDDVRPALDATVDLVGALGRAVGDLSSGPQGAMMLERITEAVPEVAEGVESLTANLGPAAIDALASGSELLGELAGQAGPLTIIAQALGMTAEAVTALIRSLGPMGPAVSGVVTAALLARRLGGGGGGAGALGVGALMMSGGRGGRGGAGRGLSATEAALLGGGSAMAAGRLARMRSGAGTFTGDVRGRFGWARHLGYGRVGAAGTAIGGAGRIAMGGGALATAGRGLGVAGRAAWPLLLASGGLTALTTEGDALDKAQGGASAMTMGLVPRPISDEEKRTRGGQFAEDVIGQLPTGNGLQSQRKALSRLRHEVQTSGGNDSLDWNTTDVKVATKILKDELRRREALLKESEQRVRDNLRAKSVLHAEALIDDFSGAFAVRARGPGGPEHAMVRMTNGVLTKMRGMREPGRRVLAENMLVWAQEQAKSNPQLQDEVDALRKGIVRSFRQGGDQISIVNGQILTGSKSEWKNIRLALTTQTEAARQEVSEDFTAIQQQAVGSLKAMGYSPAQAAKIVRDLERGGQRGKVAAVDASQGPTGANMRPSANTRNQVRGRGPAPRRSRTGDGLGNATMGGRGASVNLMGADPALAGYASEAAGFGLRVTSGLRPGAITSYGNQSYHGSGDALDVSNGSGPTPQMMAFAKYMAQTHGSQLEELIYTPLGFCVPEDTLILTRRGWLRHDEVREGDETVGYDTETGQARWTQVLEVLHFGEEQLVELRSKAFRFRCTPGHRWATERRSRRDGERVTVEEMTTAAGLTSEHRIIVSAPLSSDVASLLAPDEAALVGWLVTDGYVTTRYPTGAVRNAVIYQSEKKVEQIGRLRALLARLEVPHTERPRQRDRDAAVVDFLLSAPWVERLLERAGDDFDTLVLGLSYEARQAMFAAMFDAEGTTTKTGQRIFSQNEGPVLEAFVLLAQLLGERPSRCRTRVAEGRRPHQTVTLAKARVGGVGVGLRVGVAGRARVWCVRTELGTWTAQQNGVVTITGNSIKNGQRTAPIAAADHYDHVHIADTAPGAGGGGLAAMVSMDTAGPGMMSVSLDAPGSSLGGFPGLVSGAASGMYAAGLEKALNAALGGGGAGIPGGGGGSAAAIRARFGLPAIFDDIRYAESRNDPNARNPSGASGWYQIMMPLHAALVQQAAQRLGEPANVFDPEVNTMVAKMLYDQAGLSPWTASKGMWAKAGSYGDGTGRGRVMLRGGGGSVMRASGDGRGRGGGPVFHNTVHVNATGGDAARIQAIVERKLDQFVSEVEDEINAGSEESSMELMS